MMDKCEIKHHDHCECYTLTVDGKFCGNFDTVSEAAAEFDRLRLQEEAAIDNLLHKYGEVPA